jgi:hypothetical protein
MTAVESATPVPEGASAGQEVATTEKATLFEVLQVIPDETNLVVLDENGLPLPLASQEAADLIAASDPVWCPGNQAPTPQANGCSDAYGTLAALVSAIGGATDSFAAPISSGTIWITSGPVADASAVSINGLAYTNWSNYSLTLQGGWSGISGDTSIGLNSLFTVPISISNWHNSLAINNIDMNGANILITDSNASVHITNVHIDHARGFGLGIFGHNGNVTIDNSTVTNTVADFGGTSYYPFGDGVDIFTNGNITIQNNSNFSNNAFDGLYTSASGVIDISNSHFNNNLIGGLDAYNSGAITVADTEFTGNPYYDLSVFCSFPFFNSLSLLFDDSIPTATPPGPTLVDFSVDPSCALSNYQLKVGKIISTSPPKQGSNSRFQPSAARYITLASKSRSEFNIFCDGGQTSFTVPLPNGDKVEIVCPVRGRATISRLDNTILPSELPAGYTYASAFQLDISKIKEPFEMVDGELLTELIPVITEGGYIKASFVPTSLPVGRTYAVLFWDLKTGRWIPLKSFMAGHSFKLVPEAPDDLRVIRSGVQFLSNSSGPHIEVSTNFPGIFVLAQH